MVTEVKAVLMELGYLQEKMKNFKIKLFSWLAKAFSKYSSFMNELKIE